MLKNSWKQYICKAKFFQRNNFFMNQFSCLSNNWAARKMKVKNKYFLERIRFIPFLLGFVFEISRFLYSEMAEFPIEIIGFRSLCLFQAVKMANWNGVLQTINQCRNKIQKQIQVTFQLEPYPSEPNIPMKGNSALVIDLFTNFLLMLLWKLIYTREHVNTQIYYYPLLQHIPAS